MNIGVVSNADISSFLDYFEDSTSKSIIEENGFQNSAPAVNTIMLSFLKSKHYVRLFTLSRKDDFVVRGDNIDIYGIKACTRYPVKYLWGNFINSSRIRKVLMSNIDELDVLHAHWTYSYAYAVASFSSRVPVFCTVRDWTPYIWKIVSLKNKVTWSFNYLMNELVFYNKKINFIANSPYTAALIKRKYKINCRIIPNSIRNEYLREEAPLTPDNLEIVCISSSNDRRKNVDRLLFAFSKLVHRYPDAHLTIIGPGFKENFSWRKKMEESGFLKNVNLMGSVKHADIIDFLDGSRLFVSPSLEETFGNTIIESMARRIPVIAGRNSGAIPYVLRNGDVGYLCDVNKEEDIFSAIDYLYKNPEFASELSKRAYSVILDEYTETKACKLHIELYESLI